MGVSISYIKDTELIIIDIITKSEFKIVLPFDLKKNYNEYTILFPNNNIALINTDNGIYYYNFSNSDLILLGDNWKYLIDNNTNNIIVFSSSAQTIFKYYYFDQNTLKLSKLKYDLNRLVSLIDFNDSIIRFGNGNDDFLFQINKDGSFSRITQFWKNNIYAFCKNKNEILAFTFDNSFTNYIVYSNINSPLKIPNELIGYNFPFYSFSSKNDILFSYFSNDFTKIIKFKFEDRKFYYLDEDILSSYVDFSDGPMLKNIILKNGKMYFHYLKKGDNLQFESKILYESYFTYNHDYLNFGPYKGAYLFASEERKNPQIYKLKESNIDFKWIPFDTENLILNEEKDFEVVLYPNPNSGIYSILSEQKIDKVLLFNLLGQKIFETNEIQNLNNNFLAKGLYILQIYSGNKFVTKRLIKQ